MMNSKPLKIVLVLIIVIILIISAAGFLGFFTEKGGIATIPEEEAAPVSLVYDAPYVFNREGYEPGIAVDSYGNLYYTAHKNVDRGYQDRINTWGNQLASWFFMSMDNGQTWYVPEDPFPQGGAWKQCLGDEGDIGVDADDYVYFVDTTLRDINIHVWANQGEWQYTAYLRRSSVEWDDRPWTAAQGSGIVHYLGNNAVTFPGHEGRYIYYRSTNGAQTFSMEKDVPGNGWLHIETDRYGDHAYIVKETTVGAPADIVMHISDDQGVSWNWDDPVYIGTREGPGGPPGEGSRWPVVAVGENGTVFTLWGDYQDCTDDGSHLFLGRSNDYGQTWNTTEITALKGVHDYPWIAAGPEGSVAVAFYGTEDLPVSSESEWYIYSGMQLHADEEDINLNFSKADPNPVYVGDNYHALHDFFEICIGPDLGLNIAYQYYVGPGNGNSDLYFVRGMLPDIECVDDVCET